MNAADDRPEGGRLPAERVFQETRPYGDPMRDALATGDVNEMRRVSGYARSWLATAEAEVAQVRQLLDNLDSAIADTER